MQAIGSPAQWWNDEDRLSSAENSGPTASSPARVEKALRRTDPGKRLQRADDI
jgi:hypothetical protein